MSLDRICKTFLCLFIFLYGRSQDFSNKGTEFWVGYGYHQSMSVDNNQNMILYFTSDEAATVKVEIPALGWVRTYSLAANSIQESAALPKTSSQDSRLLTEGVSNKGIHITSDRPIVAYAHIYNSTNSGASLLFPVHTLGQDYYSLNYTQRANTTNSNSWSYVIATEDKTIVEIIPAANTLTHKAGQPFTVTLNKGEIYNLMGQTVENNGEDLTGTRIRSISSGLSGCKKIAVFSGSGRLSINCDNTYASTSDNAIQQVFPRNAWGKKFLTVPTEKLPNNFFRIAVSDPATVVTVDGMKLTNLVNSFYYELSGNTPKSILADKPIMVSQYITSANASDMPTCGNSFTINGDPYGDPEMIYLSPVEQTIDNITLNSTNHFDITSHFINVIIKTIAVGTFTLDNASKVTAFVQHPQDPSYSYAVFNVSKGNHNLKADSGFNAIAYGYGVLESYGYNAGTNIKDLYQFITLKNEYALVDEDLTCKSTKFFFRVTLPYRASSLTWDFGLNAHLTPNQPVVQNNPFPDTSYIKDGTTLYGYSLPSLYSYDAVGTYPLRITANNQTSDGCNGIQELSFAIQVLEAPKSDFTYTFAGCVNDTVFFKDASLANGRAFKAWRWDFGDQTKDSVINPGKVFSAPGAYNIKYTTINDIGCATDTSKVLTIRSTPVAAFSLSGPTCEGLPITFTDSSSIEEGQLQKWFWTFGENDRVVNTTNASVIKTYPASGDYAVSLQVENESGCKSDTARSIVSIRPSPVAKFMVPKVCVNDAFAAFTNSSYMPGNAGATLSYFWNFGDAHATSAHPNTSMVQNANHKYVVAGTYQVSLTVSSVTGCSTTISETIIVSSASPKAAFILVNEKVICSGVPVTIKNTSSIDTGVISRVEIAWDSENVPSVNDTDSTPDFGKLYHHSYPTLQVEKKYQVRVRVFSGTTCYTETVLEVNVHPAPKVLFSSVPPLCEDDSSFMITQANETSGVIGTFYFSGKGVSANGLFDPKVAGRGSALVKYVFISSAGCRDSASQVVEVLPKPDITVNSPLFVLEGGAVYLNPVISANAISFTWLPATYLDYPNIKNPISKPADSITYKITAATAAGCVASTTISVIVLKSLHIPNVFSPNGDGINDSWNIPTLSNYPGGIVEVYNRLGAVVFRSVGYSKPWNGTFNGTALPVGVYYYVINLKNGSKPMSGYVTIIK